MANSPYVSGYDRQDTGYASNRGENILQRSYSTSDDNQKQSICSQGNQSINPQWVGWQAWIARNGADEGNYCY